MGIIQDVKVLIFGDNTNKDEREKLAVERRIARYRLAKEKETERCVKLTSRALLLKSENDADKEYRDAKNKRIEAQKTLRIEKQRKAEYHPNPILNILHNYAQSKSAKKTIQKTY